jgi:two-component system, NarL family, response regulator NreC
MPKVRIVVADDHTLIRSGIVGLLNAQPDMEVVGEAGSGIETLEQTARHRPEVVLLDVTMPDGNGLETAKQIKQRFPEVQVLMLTVHDRQDYLFQALRAGAAGYILKGADVQDLLAGIRAVCRGEVYLQPSLTKRLVTDVLRRAASGEDPGHLDSLSEREREVLRLIAHGRTSNEIAQTLVLSPHTVQTHRDHIMEKLNLHRKADLIRYAIRTGLVDSEE